MSGALGRAVHILALGAWFGGAGFFNLVVAVSIFDSFQKVVADGPSDRTANRAIIPAGATEEDKKGLANALAGAAVGPVFPKYFGMQAVCGVLAFATAVGWRAAPGRVHRVRVAVLGAALLTVAVGWPISNHVSVLRPLRFDPDAAVARKAADDFRDWHLVSLVLSLATIALSGVGLALAAKLPPDRRLAG